MDFSSQIQSMLIALATVVAVLLLLAYGVRVFRDRVQSGNSDLEVLSATHVGPKERLVLVRVRDREVLLGVGPQSICSLGEFAAAPRRSSAVSAAGSSTTTDDAEGAK